MITIITIIAKVMIMILITTETPNNNTKTSLTTPIIRIIMKDDLKEQRQ